MCREEQPEMMLGDQRVSIQLEEVERAFEPRCHIDPCPMKKEKND
jgi:hypothetical protein